MKKVEVSDGCSLEAENATSSSTFILGPKSLSDGGAEAIVMNLPFDKTSECLEAIL
jgi:hypothetical protein